MVCSFKASVNDGKIVLREERGTLSVEVNGRTIYERPKRSYFFIWRSLILFEYKDGVTVHEIEKNPLYPFFEINEIYESKAGLGRLRRHLLLILLTGWRPKPALYRIKILMKETRDMFEAVMIGLPSSELYLSVERCGKRKVEVWRLPLDSIFVPPQKVQTITIDKKNGR